MVFFFVNHRVDIITGLHEKKKLSSRKRDALNCAPTEEYKFCVSVYRFSFVFAVLQHRSRNTSYYIYDVPVHDWPVYRIDALRSTECSGRARVLLLILHPRFSITDVFYLLRRAIYTRIYLLLHQYRVRPTRPERFSTLSTRDGETRTACDNPINAFFRSSGS